MREVYSYKQLNCCIYPPWKTGATAPDFSKLHARADSNEVRLAVGLSTENCFFLPKKHSLAIASFLYFPGPGTDWLQQGRPSLWCFSTVWTPPSLTTSVIGTVVRGAASPAADVATPSASSQRSRVSLSVFLHRITFSWQDFKSTSTWPSSTPIALQGSNSTLCRAATAAATAVFNKPIPV